MKLVGEAVRGYSGSNITSIGIASWGIIKNKEQLLKPTKRKEVIICLFTCNTTLYGYHVGTLPG